MIMNTIPMTKNKMNFACVNLIFSSGLLLFGSSSAAPHLLQQLELSTLMLPHLSQDITFHLYACNAWTLMARCAPNFIAPEIINGSIDDGAWNGYWRTNRAANH
jgi:hypothetical protein